MRNIASPLDGFLSPFGPRRGRAFSPAAIFAASEPGIWLDPSDTTTLFTDTAGTTPVTAAGQTVALALDKSRGLVRGPELVTNGDFSNGTTGWATSNASQEVVSGRLKVTSTSGSVDQRSSQTVNGLTAGRTYRVTAAMEPEVGKTCRITVGAGRAITTGDGPQNVSFVFTASGTSVVVFLELASGAFWMPLGSFAYFDNISVRELAGNHAVQATAASRPTYGVVPSTGRRNLLTYSEQFDNAAWGKFGTTITANSSLAPDGTVTAETATAGSTSNAINNAGLTLSAVPYALSVYLKSGSISSVRLGLVTSGSALGAACVFNLSNGTAGTVSQFGSTTGSTASIESVGNGWYRCRITVTATAATWFFQTDTNSVLGSYLVWGAQLEASATATAYQRVTSAFDVTEAGVQSVPYLFDDLVDDQINFTATAGTNYTVAWVDTAGTVTIQTAQSLSGTTDALRAQRMAGYLAINRALTAGETTSLTNWFKAKAGVAP